MMKTVFTLALTMLLWAAGDGLAAERTFQIDPVHSTVMFRIRHLYSMFTGRFNSFSGTLTADMEKPESLKVSAEVDVLSVDTANEARNKHLRSDDFFKTEKFASARFESKRVVVEGKDKGRVIGDLTLCGVTREITFRGEFLGHGIDHKGGHRVGFHATAKIDRGDFGIDYNATLPNGKTMLGTEVELVIDVEAVEVDDADAVKPAGE